MKTYFLGLALAMPMNKIMIDRIGRAGSVCYRLVARQNMDNTRWNRGPTRRVNNRRCSLDLTWLAISQAGVNDFICRQYLHCPDN
jgi:hypothetical protein